MATRRLPEKGLKFRSSLSLWLVVLLDCLLLAMTAHLSVEQGPMFLLTGAGPWFLGAFLLWWLLVYPVVHLHEDGITVVNPVQTHRLGYADLVDVSTRRGLRLITRHRKISAVSAPAGGAASLAWTNREHFSAHPQVAYRGESRTLLVSDARNLLSGSAAEAIRLQWQSRVEAGTQGDEAEPISTWNAGVLSVLAVLVLLTVMSVLL